jgi:hypothetical protein
MQPRQGNPSSRCSPSWRRSSHPSQVLSIPFVERLNFGRSMAKLTAPRTPSLSYKKIQCSAWSAPRRPLTSSRDRTRSTTGIVAESTANLMIASTAAALCPIGASRVATPRSTQYVHLTLLGYDFLGGRDGRLEEWWLGHVTRPGCCWGGRGEGRVRSYKFKSLMPKTRFLSTGVERPSIEFPLLRKQGRRLWTPRGRNLSLTNGHFWKPAGDTIMSTRFLTPTTHSVT